MRLAVRLSVSPAIGTGANRHASGAAQTAVAGPDGPEFLD
jgi:hypothetical protein